MRIKTGEYQKIELFLKAEESGAAVILSKDGNEKIKPLSYDCERVCFEAEAGDEYELELRNCVLCLGYLSECECITDKGICFLEDGKYFGRADLKQWYDTPDRGQYHFSPFKNWLNDPNGLCWYKGFYHMYYQFNPFGQQWGNMYWGHAASRDLIHWVHLPVVFEPQAAVLADKSRKGGAFSGSALICGDEMEVYFTRHDTDKINEECGAQYQVFTKSTDGMKFDEEKTIITRPEGMFSHHFRDPKVFLYEGKKYLVLGSRNNGAPAILLYEENNGQWRFVSSLLEEHEIHGITTFECPDFFELDGFYTAVAAFMHHADCQGRKQGTYYYTGRFNGNKFSVLKRELYDFGTDFYAVQSFEHDGRRIAVGWISDFWNEYEEREGGANGSMSIPRELHIKDGHLYQKPVKEIEALFGEKLYEGSEDKISVNIPGSTWYANIRIKPGSRFSLLLAREDDKELRLIGRGTKTLLKAFGTKSETADFEAVTKPVSHIEIFMDRKVCEIFINDGEAAGAKVFYKKNTDGIFKAVLESPEAVKVSKVNGSW